MRDSNNYIYIHRPHGNDLYEVIDNIGEKKKMYCKLKKRGDFW